MVELKLKIAIFVTSLRFGFVGAVRDIDLGGGVVVLPHDPATVAMVGYHAGLNYNLAWDIFTGRGLPIEWYLLSTLKLTYTTYCTDVTCTY